MRYALSRSLARSHSAAQDEAHCDRAGEMHQQRMCTVSVEQRGGGIKVMVCPFHAVVCSKYWQQIKLRITFKNIAEGLSTI